VVGRTVIEVTGEFDESLAATFKQAAEDGDGDVVVELGGVTYADSSALRCLVKARQSLAERGHQLRVGSRSEPVARLFDITGLSNEFPAPGA
jgi:anti-sigma B factor antagonist